MNATFEDQLAGLTPEQVNEAVAIMDELGAAREAMAIVEGHVAGLLAQLGTLADAQASASKNSRAGADARRSLAAQIAITQGVAPGEARAQLKLAELLQGSYPETLAALQGARSRSALPNRLCARARGSMPTPARSSTTTPSSSHPAAPHDSSGASSQSRPPISTSARSASATQTSAPAATSTSATRAQA